MMYVLVHNIKEIVYYLVNKTLSYGYTTYIQIKQKINKNLNKHLLMIINNQKLNKRLISFVYIIK